MQRFAFGSLDATTTLRSASQEAAGQGTLWKKTVVEGESGGLLEAQALTGLGTERLGGLEAAIAEATSDLAAFCVTFISGATTTHVLLAIQAEAAAVCEAAAFLRK